MAVGKKIAENPEVEAYVVKALRENVFYRIIVEEVRKRFNVIISIPLLSQFKKNYLGPGFSVFQKGVGLDVSVERNLVPINISQYEEEIKSMEDRMGEINRKYKGGWLMSPDGILSFYSSRMARLEKQIDMIIELKEPTNAQVRTFISLMDLQSQMHQKVHQLFFMDRRETELLNIVGEIVSLVTILFLEDLRDKDAIKYHKTVEDFKRGVRAVVDRYLGRET